MITKKTIQKKIDELEKKIQQCKEGMDFLRNDAKFAEEHEDYIRTNLIISDFDQLNGMIKGLQFAIDQLKELL